MSTEPVSRVVLLAGATGLVGSELLNGLLADATVTAVHVLARRPLALTNPKAVVHVVDFKRLPELPPVEEVYLALGTTIRVAGSQEAFRAVDFEANLAVARAAEAAGARCCGLVSALGADAKSRIFYNRVKGELEDALTELPFEGLTIAQPSLLMGNRERLGQPFRPMEKLSIVVSRVLAPLIPKAYRPISAEKVARALLACTPTTHGKRVLPSAEMQGY